MAIKVVDMAKEARENPRRQVRLNTPRFHAWLHVYPNPGDMDDMHCHNADQTWFMIEGPTWRLWPELYGWTDCRNQSVGMCRPTPCAVARSGHGPPPDRSDSALMACPRQHMAAIRACRRRHS